MKEQTRTINTGANRMDVLESESEPLAVWDPEVGMYISSNLMKNEVGNYVLKKEEPKKKDQSKNFNE